ncbi:MAG: phosphorylase [Bacteroidetes bacterium]|nr:MAG: phosphorylase [Bacteroidota bacterium]TAE67632.1 MAG: phosphorylase [Bacteroidota bacterium]TAF93650.1 MAG: phosphorylase [Bacteroidota bacterium]
MAVRIAESELIINNRGAVYHLNLRPEELAETIITVGDPDRVAAVSQHFDSIEFTTQHREFVTHTGYVGNKRISCVSTGIGPDNIDIVLNELDALVNINFETRTEHAQPKALQIVRLGTSGSLQADVPVDSFVASTYGLGLDNLLHFYKQHHSPDEEQILQHFTPWVQLQASPVVPYISAASIKLLKHFATGYHHGITVTCPGFYGPQGRVLRLPVSQPQLIPQLSNFYYGNHRITNFEMETSAIYGLGKLLGHHCLSISTIVANRVSQTFSTQADKSVQTMIQNALTILENA